MTKLDALNKKLKLYGDKKLESTPLGSQIMDKFYCLTSYIPAEPPINTKESA